MTAVGRSRKAATHLCAILGLSLIHILRHCDRKVVPGGGANAIYNLADLGVNVLPVGVLGDDEPGKLLLRAFRHKRIPVSGVFKDKSYTTVTKTRILAGFAHTAGQQVVRLDREPAEGPNSHLRREIILAAREYARASDALLVSDYGYGAATPALLNFCLLYTSRCV